MARHSFPCFDGHTCGNPVRLIAGGAPLLRGRSMSEKRQDFLDRFDWIRTALMFEPRGHDMMSGAFLYPPSSEDADASILFVETSGCLPMCGHGTIGTITLAIENGLISPKTPGRILLDAPAGRVIAEYEMEGEYVAQVRIFNVPSYLAHQDVRIDVPGLGEIILDIAYGGNFYAIIEPQPHYRGLEAMSVGDLLRFSPLVRKLADEAAPCVHPLDPTVRGVSHVQWTDKPRNSRAHGRNAVFYGEKAIDRSPCGTGTSARMAQLAARGDLRPGEAFIHESIIGSLFDGRHEGETRIGNMEAILPSVAGWARMTGINTLFVDDRDPFAHGFQLL
ncbi:4-hydroxyproline epimerase [Sphingopyxis sp. MWB1]|uniref:4-hydroxyproline epimerase n=1 Tax=Sphingopyxis sp. MWB1 TaxID=1537715 RepID=UPI00051A0829|nr:4-hydroxyproline epimerase [Sphingopyxis sp. MWB1]